jgi:F-type H+-transporting ATPase subunit b
MRHLLADPEIWVLVSFIVFFVLFGGRLWAAIAGLLDGRADAIRAELAEAQRLRSEAEAMLADAKRARTEALAEAAEVLLRSHAEAAQVAQAALAEAEAAGKRRERLAIDRIAAAEKAAVAEVRQAAAEVATRAAAMVIAGGLPEETQSALVDQAIADLPRALRAA